MELHNEKLTFWVFSGRGGKNSSPEQIASHILFYKDDKEIIIHSIEEYYNLLKNKKVRGNFGTFFSWTYNHKNKGKYIVLQSKIIIEK